MTGPEFHYEPAHDLGLPPVERARSLRREAGLVETFGHWIWGRFVRVYFAGWHRLSVKGRSRVPAAPPFVLVANHSSHLDALALSTLVRAKWCDRIFPIAAGDTFFETPARAIFAALMLNALPMWRKSAGRHALAALRERLVGEPCAYILFPEGTRSRTGEMGPFRPGLGMLVAGTPVPVVPCRLEGAWRAFPPGAAFPRPRKLRLFVGEPLAFEKETDDRAGWERIAEKVESAVRALGKE